MSLHRSHHIAAWCIAALAAPLATASTGSSSSPAQSAIAAQINAAAERFEQLTEESFTADASALHRRIDAASGAAHRIAARLPPRSAERLQAEVAELSQAAKAESRADVALASIECYRVLEEAVPRHKIPAQVSLLDYAGFRYDADLKAQPTRWTDMQTAAEYAMQQWRLIQDRISDQRLKNEFQGELGTMKRAALGRQLGVARQAVAGELDAVDKLESYFSR